METTENNEEQNTEKGGGTRETILAFLICAIILVLPVLLIENEYKQFTKEHGVAKEGAAGAGLWLAVMFRTVSRTVLRTIIRTSARAGMRASLRGAFRTGVRTIGRTQSKILADQNVDQANKAANRQKNIKSLALASVLLYLSWIIVIGWGQPFSKLLYQNSEELVLEQEDLDQKKRLIELQELAITAFEREQAWKTTRKELRTIEKDIKMEREMENRTKLEQTRDFLRQKEMLDARAFEEAFAKSKKEKLNPKHVQNLPEEEEEKIVRQNNWLQTLAPYPSEPTSGTKFTLKLENITYGEQKIPEIEIPIEVGKPILQQEHPEKIISENRDDFVLHKLVPDPSNAHWVQLRSGIEVHFSQKIDSIESAEIIGEGVQVEQVVLGTDYATIIFGGVTPWTSKVIWLGGFVIVIPLWFIYFMQSWASRREGLTLKHETGPVGGGIQLYFAGAFSFMPLTSDVVVDDADVFQRSRIALWGLLTPSLVALGIWALWLQIQDPRLLFLSDAFLIFPMVQCFPLNPLEGIYVWRRSKLLWFVTFAFIMTLFMIVASAGLKSVI